MSKHRKASKHKSEAPGSQPQSTIEQAKKPSILQSFTNIFDTLISGVSEGGSTLYAATTAPESPLDAKKQETQKRLGDKSCYHRPTRMFDGRGYKADPKPTKTASPANTYTK